MDCGLAMIIKQRAKVSIKYFYSVAAKLLHEVRRNCEVDTSSPKGLTSISAYFTALTDSLAMLPSSLTKCHISHFLNCKSSITNAITNEH